MLADTIDTAGFVVDSGSCQNSTPKTARLESLLHLELRDGFSTEALNVVLDHGSKLPSLHTPPTRSITIISLALHDSWTGDSPPFPASHRCSISRRDLLGGSLIHEPIRRVMAMADVQPITLEHILYGEVQSGDGETSPIRTRDPRAP